MYVKMKKFKDPEFCFCCGREIKKGGYILSLGTAGSSFELCKSCLKKLTTKADKALTPK